MTDVSTEDLTDDPAPRPGRRGLVLVGAAAAMIVIVGLAVALAGGDDSGDPAAEESIALTAVAEDPLTTMCIEVTADTIRDSGIELAFRGTVTEIDGDVATLAVDHWYLGGDAGTVTVTGPVEADVALLGAVPLEEKPVPRERLRRRRALLWPERRGVDGARGDLRGGLRRLSPPRGDGTARP